jgi:hypothetical protein
LGIGPYTLIAVCTCAAFFLFESVARSFSGFMNHAEVAFTQALYLMPFFPVFGYGFRLFGWARPVSPAIAAAPLILLASAVSLAYSFIGLRRIMYGRLDIFTGDSILTYLGTNALEYSRYMNKLGVTLAASSTWQPILKIGFFATTILEVLTPLVLFSGRFRFLWLVIMILFHFSTWLLMNIFFW